MPFAQPLNLCKHLQLPQRQNHWSGKPPFLTRRETGNRRRCNSLVACLPNLYQIPKLSL